MDMSYENKKVSQRIIEYIQSLIMEDMLKTGDRLPSERELAERLKVGRPALREALKALEIIGVIEMRHGQGNFIVNNTPVNSLKPLAISFKLDNGDNFDILELRYLVETFTARKAALNATEDDVARLRKLHEDMKNADTLKEKTVCDSKLHLEIAKISNNKLIENLFLSVSYLFDIYTRNTVSISIMESRMDDIYNEHLALIQAIAQHEPVSAVNCMVLHLNKIEML